LRKFGERPCEDCVKDNPVMVTVAGFGIFATIIGKNVRKICGGEMGRGSFRQIFSVHRVGGVGGDIIDG